MWSRITRSYGRVLRGGALLTHTEQARFGVMQLRSRSGAAGVETAAVDGRKPSPRRKRAIKVEAVALKEEVVNVVPSRPRKRISKTSIAIKSEVYEGLAEGIEDGVKDEKPAKRKKRAVAKKNKDGTPENWQRVMSGIQEMRAMRIADVDVAGAEIVFDENAAEPHLTRFHVLISAMLSSQTKDPVNYAAMKRLTERGLTVASMLEIDEKELAQILRPVGFFNNKAKYIKQVAQILTDKAAEDGADIVDIPNTFDGLVALPGVGPKMAHLVMSCAWKHTVGICVDTHVHRISNRLGWVSTWNKKNPKSQDPEKTRKELEDWLPFEHWNPINVLLVGFGQTVCLPRGPKCDECKIKNLCPSAYSSAI